MPTHIAQLGTHQDAVRLVVEQDYKQTEAARNLGIDRGMLARWIQEYQLDESETFRGNGKLTTEGEELRCLREENRYLFPLPAKPYRAGALQPHPRSPLVPRNAWSTRNRAAAL